jgi:uncharacterized membrane protein
MEDTQSIINFFMIFFACTGVLVIGLSIPMIQQKLKPNGWYGFRTTKTLSDEKIWYPANTYSGKLLLGVGILWVLSAVVLRFIPGIGSDLVTYNLTQAGVVLGSLVVLILLSLRYLNTL